MNPDGVSDPGQPRNAALARLEMRAGSSPLPGSRTTRCSQVHHPDNPQRWTTDLPRAYHFWRRMRLLLVALVVCRGVVVLSILPPFEGWDEYQHVAYVEHMRQTGQAPIAGQTTVSPALLSELVKFPQPAGAIKDTLRGIGAVDYSTFWNRLGSTSEWRSSEDVRSRTVLLYQAQHSPFFYRLAVPLFVTLGGVQNLRWSVAGMRLMNIGLIAAAVWVSLEILRRILKRERDAALIGMAIAAHPLFLMNGARVANDALGVFLATLAVASSLSLVSLTDARRLALHGAATGCLIGLAILAKATNFALVPFAAICWLMLLIRLRLKGMGAPLAALALGLGLLAVIQSEVRFNFEHYGSFTPMQEVLVNQRGGRTTADLLKTASTVDWPRTMSQLWDRELFFVGGWSFMRSNPRLVMMYRDLVHLGLTGWIGLGVILAVRRRDLWKSVYSASCVPIACIALVLSYTAALGYHTVQSKLAWGEPSTGSWYASPALPWFLVLVAGGVMSLPLGRCLRSAVPLGLAGVSLAAEATGIFGQMIPKYTGWAPWSLALNRLAWLQPPWLGTPTLLLAIAAEVTVLAVIALVWRDEVMGKTRPESSLRHGHVQVRIAGPHYRLGPWTWREPADEEERRKSLKSQ